MESDNIQKVSHTSQRKLSTRHDQKQQANTKHISRAPNHEDEVYILCLDSESAQPIMVDLNIEEKKLSMDVDTGVAFSLISDQTRRAMFSNLKLQESKIRLKTSTDQHIKVVGTTTHSCLIRGAKVLAGPTCCRGRRSGTARKELVALHPARVEIHLIQ